MCVTVLYHSSYKGSQHR